MPTEPTPIAALPAHPSITEADFAEKADAFVAALAEDFVPKANALATNTYNNAVEAAGSATTATTAAGNAAADVAAAVEADADRAEEAAEALEGMADAVGTFYDLTGKKYENAAEIWVDANNLIFRIVWNDGTELAIPGINPTISATLTETVLLPTPTLSASNDFNGGSLGFTCTGAAHMWQKGNGSFAEYRGCFLVCNGGSYLEAGDARPRNAALLILSPDLRTIIKEILFFPVSGETSNQGVAWDSSDDTAWVADKFNSIIRHVTMAGGFLSDPIALDYDPNGIAYHPGEDAIYTHNETTGEVKLISCADGSTVIQTFSMPTNIDQLHYRSDKNWLIGTRGVNGAECTIYIVNGTTGAVVAELTLEGSQSIEGCTFDNFGRLIAFNDGARHTAARPRLAVANIYTFNAGA